MSPQHPNSNLQTSALHYYNQQTHSKCSKLFAMSFLLLIFFLLAGAFQTPLKAQCSTCGNSYLNVTDNSSINYDNIVSTFHSTIAQQQDGTVLVWGESIDNNGSSHVLIPKQLNSSNYPALTGDILKIAAGSNSQAGIGNGGQFLVLTTTGLFAWGNQGVVLDAGRTTSSTFQKLTINGEADGLPSGVDPGDVKMLFATYRTLALLTCGGEVWVLSQHNEMRGIGNTSGNTSTWYKVTYANDNNNNNNGTLSGITAVRGCPSGLMALKSDGTVWIWGLEVYLGNGNNEATRTRARSMTLTYTPPNPDVTITPKMIGMTGRIGGNSYTTSHYILGTDGFVYSLGENNDRQLGDRSTTERTSWVRVQSANNTDLANVAWISPNEHDNEGAYAVNALTSAGKLWSWGANERNMIGGSDDDSNYNPFNNHNGISASDEIIAVETGGHTSMVIKKCNSHFGYVGHRVNGSMADGVSASAQETSYNFTGTATLNICGAPSGAANLPQPPPNNGINYVVGEQYTLTPTPAGGTLTLAPGSPATLVGNTLTIGSPNGNPILITYTNAPGTCGDGFFDIAAGDITLSAVFGSITATRFDNRLTVNWNTSSETNNNHFEIEASVDGKNFTKIGEVASQAKDGNSSTLLQYQFSQDWQGQLAMGLGLFGLGILGLGINRRKKWLSLMVLVAGITIAAAGCTKTESIELEKEGKLFIRIAQVDIDGSKSVSQVVQVVEK